MSDRKRLSMFEAFGIEVEYMLVDRETLDVRPVADRVMETSAGHPTGDIEFGAATFSNELALHVIELKGTDPTSDLASLATAMNGALSAIGPALATHGVMMLPGGMHPWMNPGVETRLWPHEYHEIYEAYHRVFDCHSHGWANVQSVHLNLPFSDDEEFARLHAAVRLVLPILPALTASSPIVDSRAAPWADMRMQFVRDHCRTVPFLTGDMIPEPIYDEATYRTMIFDGLEKAIAPFDDSGVFDPNFLNARGAIARFDRGSVEIRVMDVQEYPAADIAVCSLTIELLKAIVSERWTGLADQKATSTQTLSRWLDRISKDAERCTIDDRDYLRHFGIDADSITAGDLWKHLVSTLGVNDPLLDPILRRGSLATRITAAVGNDWRRDHLREIYRRLGDCLAGGHAFEP